MLVGLFKECRLKFSSLILEKIYLYLDDFSIYENRESHLQHVKAAFERLAIHKSSLSLEKCKLGFCEGALLRHVVCREGIKVDPKKVKWILELKTPHNHKEVLTLWGMANYYNKFIPNLAAIHLSLLYYAGAQFLSRRRNVIWHGLTYVKI